MSQSVRIAIDAMGGDHGPAVVIPGAGLALKQHANLSFVFYGDQAKIKPILQQNPQLLAVSEIIHTEVSIGMDEKPAQALRIGRRVSSMWCAVEAVKKGQADAAVSAGNTGALMAMAKICLHTLPQVDRPALAAAWPTIRGRSIVLDLGASIGAEAQELVTLAVMGAAMAQIILGIEKPSVGLLNIGVEEMKGIEEVRAASRILREGQFPQMNYLGFVEGDDLGKGTADVVVSEGFTGNIALKTAEGTAKQITHYLREAMSSSLMSKLGYLFAKKAFDRLRDQLDPRKINGGVFLGLDGIVVKSHGGTDSVGFACAIGIASQMVEHSLLSRIRNTLYFPEEPLSLEPPRERTNPS